MRKQKEFVATVVRNRTELIDATTAKTKVVLIEGDTLETLRKEIKKEKRIHKLGKSGAVISGLTTVGYLIPGWAIFSIPAAAFMGFMTLACAGAGIDSEHLKKYDMFQRLNADGEIVSLGLVWRGEYVPEDDLIISPYKIALFINNKCPKCGSKLPGKHIYGRCPNCGITLSRIRKFK